MRVLYWFLVSSMLAAGVSWAQTNQTGVIEGRILDESTAPLPGAAVRTSLADGSYPRSAVSDEDGRFRIAFLKPGLYEIQIEMTGFDTYQAKNIRVGAARITPLEITLGVAAVGESMVVTHAEPLIDRATAEYATSLDEEEVSRLPTSRTATDLIELTAGARADQVWGGSTGQANNYQLDGVSVNAPGFGGSFLLPNVNWIKEFQVKGLGAGAEYGNFQGGLVNIVTKSGSNTFEGDVYSYFENDSLNSSNLRAGEAGSEQEQFTELNASVSGALIKDRLYYFVSAEQQTSDFKVVDTSIPGNDPAFFEQREEREETKIFTKFSWDVAEGDSLKLVLGMDDVETSNRGLDADVRPEATSQQESPSNFYNLSWEHVFKDTTFMEVKLTGYDGEDDRQPLRGDAAAVQVLGGNRELGRNAVYTRERDLDSRALTVNLDHYQHTGSWVHHFKIGGEYTEGGWNERRFRNGGLTWRPELGDGPIDFNDPATWGFISSDWGGDINLDAETVNAAFYIQDYITVNDRLGLSVGLRYGRWEGEVTPGDGSGSRFTALSDSALAPRLGLTWELGDGSWVFKTHAGRYYQNMFALMFDRVSGANAFGDLQFWDWNGEGVPDLNRTYTEAEREELFSFYDDQATSQENGPVADYRQPHVDQFVVGLEKQLNDSWKVGLTYIYRENKDILALQDRNIADNYTLFSDVTITDEFTGDSVTSDVYVANDDILFVGEAPGLTSEQVDSLTWDRDFVLTNVDEATRELDQLQFKLDRVGDGWTLHGSLTWSDLRGNFYAVSGYDDPGGTGAGAFVNPNQQINFNGGMPNISEWEGKLRFTLDLPMDFLVGGFLRVDSGDAFNRFVTIDSRNQTFTAANGETFEGDHFFFVDGQSVFLEERGAREYETFTRLDLNVEKRFVFSGGSQIRLGVNAFNLLDNDAVTSEENEVFRTTALGEPRVLRRQPPMHGGSRSPRPTSPCRERGSAVEHRHSVPPGRHRPNQNRRSTIPASRRALRRGGYRRLRRVSGIPRCSGAPDRSRSARRRGEWQSGYFGCPALQEH